MTLAISCRSLPTKTSGVPELQLEHGWSPTKQMELNGQQVDVQCMTVADKTKLQEYLLILETQQGKEK